MLGGKLVGEEAASEWRFQSCLRLEAVDNRMEQA